MDYKRVLRLHFVNHLSGREIAESCGDCSKTTVNEFLKRFRECPELTYPLSEDVTNEYIAGLLYKKSGIAADQLLYRDFNKEAVYKALARKGETLKHLWQKYNAIGKASLWQVACNHKHTGTYNTDEKEGECNENLCLIQFVINSNANKYKKQNQRDPTGIIIFCKYLNRIFKKQRKRQIFGELGASGRT